MCKVFVICIQEKTTVNDSARVCHLLICLCSLKQILAKRCSLANVVLYFLRTNYFLYDVFLSIEEQTALFSLLIVPWVILWHGFSCLNKSRILKRMPIRSDHSVHPALSLLMHPREHLIASWMTPKVFLEWACCLLCREDHPHFIWTHCDLIIGYIQ